MNPLQDKRIIVGITGSIAAYKGGELVRELRREGAEVKVVMTAAAQEFVTPLTFQTLSGHPVYADLFSLNQQWVPEHISLAQWGDLVLIGPATADSISRLASGLADDLLTSVCLASQVPKVISPAMDSGMWENPLLQSNVTKLKEFGFHFSGPGFGGLASGKIGRGRFIEIGEILGKIKEILYPKKDLLGKKVLVTAGRTEEDLDPVRVLTNRSSGRMGYSLAQVARWRGGEVTLVSGPSILPPPFEVNLQMVRTTQEMRERVRESFPMADILAMAAAVADFKPQSVPQKKLSRGELSLKLEPTPDILKEVAEEKGDKFLVGFALETGDGLNRARRKLQEKNLDLIVFNDLTQEGAGFEVETNVVTLIWKDGRTEPLPKLPKLEVAERIWDRITEILH